MASEGRKRVRNVDHDIAISNEDLCQVFWQFFLTATHVIPIAYKNAFYFNALQEKQENQLVIRIDYFDIV
jgi:hypothetical protein